MIYLLLILSFLVPSAFAAGANDTFTVPNVGSVSTTTNGLLLAPTPLQWSTNNYPQAMNVVLFGADSTGGIDAQPAIQAAIDAAGPTSNTVYFPAGKYKVNSTLTITNNVSLAGSQHGAWIIPGAGSFDLIHIHPEAYMNGHRITGLKIDASGTGHTGLLIHLVGETAFQYTSATWEGLFLFGEGQKETVKMEPSSGILPDQIFNVTIKDSYFYGGIICTNVGDTMKFIGNTIGGTDTVALDFQPVGGSVGMVFQNNSVTASGGVFLRNANLSVIENNNCEQIHANTQPELQAFFRLDGCTGTRFSKNIINYGKNGSTNGVYMTNCTQTFFFGGNWFRDDQVVANYAIYDRTGNPLHYSHIVDTYLDSASGLGKLVGGVYGETGNFVVDLITSKPEYHREMQIGHDSATAPEAGVIHGSSPTSSYTDGYGGSLTITPGRQRGAGTPGTLTLSGWGYENSPGTALTGTLFPRIDISGNATTLYGYHDGATADNYALINGSSGYWDQYWFGDVAPVVTYHLGAQKPITFTWDDALTASAPWTQNQTWNSAGVTFIGMKLNLTDTTSASGSKPIQVLVNTAEKFSVDKDGNVNIAGSVTPATYVKAQTNDVPSNASTVVRWMEFTVQGVVYKIPLYK